MSRGTAAWMYHHVGPSAAPHWTSVPPEGFRQQLEWLHRRGLRGVSAGEWLRGSKDASQVILTFDDAFRDLAEHAFPLLEEFGFHATVFVVSSCVGDKNRWDAGTDAPQRATLTAQEMRAWQRRGIEFGSHTVSHPDLRSLTDDKLREELRASREQLESTLGCAVEVLAYPYGAADERVRRFAAESYSAAFTVNRGLNSATRDRFDLRRTTILPDDTGLDLAMRTRFGWNPRERIPHHLRRLLGRGAGKR